MYKDTVHNNKQLPILASTQVSAPAMLQSVLNIVMSTKAIRSDATLYCLAWLAVSRLLTGGYIVGFSRLSDLLLEECWAKATEAGLPEEAVSVVWTVVKDGRSEGAFKGRVLEIIAEFLERLEAAEESMAISIADLFVAPNIHLSGGNVYDPGLCDLLIGLLDGGSGNRLWIPFDPAGQLSIRALSLGYDVLAIGPSRDSWSVTVLRLLAVIDGNLSHLTIDAEQNSNTSTYLRFANIDYLVACPPINMKIPMQMGWRRWEGSELGLTGSDSIYKKIGGQTTVQLDRAESWAIAAFWPHVKKKAVFLTTPNLLFSKGQEQRLREFLVIGARQPSAVVYLPPRLVNHTGIVSAIIVMDRSQSNASLRMVDASKCTIESKSTMKFSRLLDARRILELIRSPAIVDEISTEISLDEVANQECNLMPSRYLRTFAADSGVRIALGDFVQSIARAPRAIKDATAITVQEVGIADLGQWSKLSGPFAKTTTIQAGSLPEYDLRFADIIISVKGTLGKVGLFGIIEAKSGPSNAVCSQSCIALRANKQTVDVLSLYLYLRSEDFRSQLDALRVGVSVAHITPATLLQDIKVPRDRLLDYSEAEERFSELCRLEAEVARAQERMEEIKRSLLTADAVL